MHGAFCGYTACVATEQRPPNLRTALGGAAALVILDALVLNQGVIAVLVGLWTLFVSLPRAAFNKVPDVRRVRLVRAGIFLAAVVLVFTLNWANNQLAKHRADGLVAAVKAYQLRHQRYPDELEDLAPDFIASVPMAKYTLMSGSFQYWSSPQRHTLLYVVFPPFARAVYNFEAGRWGSLD